jgi:cation transport ATPase
MTRPSPFVSYWILGGLALLMFVTRAQPVEHFLELPDASWAVFFIAGFYLRDHARTAFALLMLEAVAIDWVATQHLGVSAYCMTPAYAFLLPTHAAMWAGGHLLRGHARVENAHALLALVVLAFSATTLAYAISNGGFYWFGGRYPEPNAAQYLERFAMYYPRFLLTPCAYIAAAACVHVGVGRALRTPVGPQEDAR